MWENIDQTRRDTAHYSVMRMAHKRTSSTLFFSLPAESTGHTTPSKMQNDSWPTVIPQKATGRLRS